jgi:GNAT superfamily N-acetyltransferase
MLAVRKIETRDEGRWRELWDGYTRFYEREPDQAVTDQTWKQIMNPYSPVKAIVGAYDQHSVVGIANYVIHETTSALTPVCYLQDLFVDPSCRGVGTGRLLIEWLVREMKAQGWSRLYWHTKKNNYQARVLYDRFTPHSGFVRYVITNLHAS